MLVGEKVVLRGLELWDAKELHKYINNWEVRQYLTMYLPFSEVEEEEFVRDSWRKKKDRTDFIFGIDEKESGKLIGTIGLHKIDWKNRNAELGIAIWRKEYWDT
ncbi:MAG: GNAT family N-acetyltransferase [Candidatus Asgardarchaeia archaeon]